MAGKISQQEEQLRKELETWIQARMQDGANPYHLAQVLGRVRWDLLSLVQRMIRRYGAQQPLELTRKVRNRWI